MSEIRRLKLFCNGFKGQCLAAGARRLKFFRAAADMGSMRDRRTEVRMMCADMVEVTWKDGNGRTGRTMALLEDISRSGACLQLETSLPVGAEIQWGSPGHHFNGHVRHCLYREIGYFVGVELAGCQWSKTAYQPRHLLEMGRLVGAPADH
jgi:hypothetical protein